ncbi:MAG: iron-containing alcohol dehydrogenase, partial [Bacteroidales bacterium]
MIARFTQQIPTKLIFGCGTINSLETENLPGNKALIVISAGVSMRKYGYLCRVTKALKTQGVEYVVYDKIEANPVKEHVMEGAGIARSENCDFVIGLGGGSSIDSAKSIALMSVNDGDYWDYIVGGSGK